MAALYDPDRWERTQQRLERQYQERLAEIRSLYRPAARQTSCLTEQERAQHRYAEAMRTNANEDAKVDVAVNEAWQELLRLRDEAVDAYAAQDLHRVHRAHKAVHRLEYRYQQQWDHKLQSAYARKLITKADSETGHRHLGYFLAQHADLYPALISGNAGILGFAMNNAYVKEAGCNGGGRCFDKEAAKGYLQLVWAGGRSAAACAAAMIPPITKWMMWGPCSDFIPFYHTFPAEVCVGHRPGRALPRPREAPAAGEGRSADGRVQAVHPRAHAERHAQADSGGVGSTGYTRKECRTPLQRNRAVCTSPRDGLHLVCTGGVQEVAGPRNCGVSYSHHPTAASPA